jgi:H/ACA ribonucleoprotein complex subunit 3
MKTEILYCNDCDKYTTEKLCKLCETKTKTTKPVKYSPEDKYGKYRRIAKSNKK